MAESQEARAGLSCSLSDTVSFFADALKKANRFYKKKNFMSALGGKLF